MTFPRLILNVGALCALMVAPVVITHLMPKFDNVNWELVVGSCGVVIALCALIFTIWQGRQTMCHNKISVRPHLDTWTHTESTRDSTSSVSFFLINNGLGPAKINDFYFRLDGNTVSGNGQEHIESLVQEVIPYNPHRVENTARLGIGSLMAEKTQLTLARITFIGNTPPTRTRLEDSFNRVNLTVKYESMYGEKFTLDTEKTR